MQKSRERENPLAKSFNLCSEGVGHVSYLDDRWMRLFAERRFCEFGAADVVGAFVCALQLELRDNRAWPSKVL